MEIKEFPSPRPHIGRIKAYWACDAEVQVAHRTLSGRITGFDTTPGPPVSWWRQWWWRVCALWPLYRCRHDR